MNCKYSIICNNNYYTVLNILHLQTNSKFLSSYPVSDNEDDKCSVVSLGSSESDTEFVVIPMPKCFNMSESFLSQNIPQWVLDGPQETGTLDEERYSIMWSVRFSLWKYALSLKFLTLEVFKKSKCRLKLFISKIPYDNVIHNPISFIN